MTRSQFLSTLITKQGPDATLPECYAKLFSLGELFEFVQAKEKAESPAEPKTLYAKYAPKPFVPKTNCKHEHEYATLAGMTCRDCRRIREASNDFEKALVSKLTPRTSGYVNYQMR